MTLTAMEQTTLNALRVAKRIVRQQSSLVIDPMLHLDAQQIQQAITELEVKERLPAEAAPSGAMVIHVNQRQRQAIVTLVTLELHDMSLYQGYADDLNSLYTQLTGDNHHLWAAARFRPDPPADTEHPLYQMLSGENLEHEEWLSLHSAARLFDCGFIGVSFGEKAREATGKERSITKAEMDRITDLADEYSASK